MKTPPARNFVTMAAMLLAIPQMASAVEAASQVVFHEDFSGLPVEMLSAGSIGAEAEYHYIPKTGRQGDWEISCFRTEASQRTWRVLREEGFGRKFLYQASTSNSKDDYTHPILVSGDPLWSDYTVRLTFAPEDKSNLSGVVFRYRNDRCLYFFGVRKNTAVILLLNEGTGYRKSKIITLAEQTYHYKAGQYLTGVVSLEGPHIKATLPNGLTLEADDATFTQGRIGLLADVPTRFKEISVEMEANALSEAKARIAAREATEQRLQEANPRMVVWKRLHTEGFGTGRNVRFGDLDGDGRKDVLIAQVKNHGPKDRNSEVGCLTALTFDGRQLWQSGEVDPWRVQLTSDVAVQIHDIDHDGRNEVIYCRDFELVIADGATGKAMHAMPTPVSPPPVKKNDPHNKFERILGDSLYFLDLRGQGWDGDLILKDRYSRLWAYTDKLELLWEAACTTGHYPYAYDIDGDGKDELAIGYSMIDDNGRMLWSHDRDLQDHADAVAIARLNQDDPEPRLLCAASDEGVFWTDMQGQILKHLYLGHVQSPTIANLRDDLPGLETVTVNFWANQGIIHFFDSKMNPYHGFEPMQHASEMLPLNWTGRSEEFFIVSANVNEGAYDGWGRRVLRFPADGHPDLCNAVVDLTGDCRDEIVVWDPHEMWVYTQSDNPKSGRLYRPYRNPDYNESNYQASVSLPGWSTDG